MGAAQKPMILNVEPIIHAGNLSIGGAIGGKWETSRGQISLLGTKSANRRADIVDKFAGSIPGHRGDIKHRHACGCSS